MNFHLPSRPSYRNKLATIPAFFEDNQRFWKAYNRLELEALAKVTANLPPQEEDRIFRKLTDEAEEYLKNELDRYRGKWMDIPCHPDDVHAVWLEKEQEKFEKERKDPRKYTEQELREGLEKRGLGAKEIEILIRLHDRLAKSNWFPLSVHREAVIFVLGGAFANLRAVQEFSRKGRRLKAAVKSARRTKIGFPPTETGEVDKRLKVAITRYVRARIQRKNLKIAPTIRSRTFLVRNTLRELWLLVGGKTNHPFALMHRLLDEVGLLGIVHRDKNRTLDRLRKMLPVDDRPLPLKEPHIEKERVCEHCRKKFQPSRAGQRFCSNECGGKWETERLAPLPPREQEQDFSKYEKVGKKTGPRWA